MSSNDLFTQVFSTTNKTGMVVRSFQGTTLYPLEIVNIELSLKRLVLGLLEVPRQQLFDELFVIMDDERASIRLP